MDGVAEKRLVRMLSDVSSQVEEQQQITARISRQAATKKAATVASGGQFTWVNPAEEVFTQSGSAGAGAFLSYQSLDFGPYVSGSAVLAFCTVSIQAVVSGGSAADPITGIDWLADGGTVALPFYYYDQHSLVDNAEVYLSLPWAIPLGASRSGQIRVKDSPGAWTYSLEIYGYL